MQSHAFGTRSLVSNKNKRTHDVLFFARRLLESKANASDDDNLLMAALDWSKAFGSIAPDALFEALRRFGIPLGIIEMIQANY